MAALRTADLPSVELLGRIVCISWGPNGICSLPRRDVRVPSEERSNVTMFWVSRTIWSMRRPVRLKHRHIEAAFVTSRAPNKASAAVRFRQGFRRHATRSLPFETKVCFIHGKAMIPQVTGALKVALATRGHLQFMHATNIGDIIFAH